MSYTYAKAITDTLNDKVDGAKLKMQIAGSGLTSATVENIDTDEDINALNVIFDVEPSAPDKATVDGVVAAHDGVAVPSYVFHASSTLCEGERSITDADWMILGGVVTTPSFFMPDLTKSLARVVGSCRAIGEGVELRVCEDGVPMGGSYPLTESADWTQMQWYITSPPTVGTHTYTLEGKLNGGTSGAVRFVSMSLLEVVTVESPE